VPRLLPHGELSREYLTTVVAVLGTTISLICFSGKPRRKSKGEGLIMGKNR